MTKISIERSAYNKAGSILLSLINFDGIENKILDEKNEVSIILFANNIYEKCEDEKKADKIIMCLRAGSLSEKNYCRFKCIIYDDSISGNELWLISRISYPGKNGPDNFEAHLKNLEDETEKLLTTHWPFVIILARKLISNKYYSISEIYELWSSYISKR